ncbi:MAG: bifunctional 4-hydroxy-2-oxoglutarate aldolase/2-dehydro-3-deoxy-phosphogluconate aldolase [Clostridia bacterium]|nr:bifunctional 4-hydroxy-2-oxoglutarate aldolase/2-dehydro-3-deoxy-phosphogluconate aldolase [Clostridia bacterium]MBO5315570.1 bifunctional 4-hydroxy-2-oxoglutarate aldolase/2-dehydro-3-deoxy-phosphogluconate aldolase [Clostridia bacterium]
MNNDMMKELYSIGLIPVIKIENPDDAVPLAKALIDGGLPAAEITFRTACAAEAIKNITEAYPEMLVGAGTVLTCEQVDAAIAAGSKFIVSPGLNPKVVSYCLSKGVPMLPGCSNPSDVEVALELGLKTVKFFPAEAVGGLKMLKAMAAPYGQLTFMPTGGINADNLLDYLKFNKIVACGGSFMVKDELVKEKKWDEITALTKDAVKKMLGLEFTHMGINTDNKEEAEKSAKLFNLLFGMPIKETSKSYFAGDAFEFMMGKGPGKCGHIGIKTHFVDRAIAYFKRMGFEFDESSITYDDKTGKPKFVYFKDEIAGFAVHLVQK